MYLYKYCKQDENKVRILFVIDPIQRNLEVIPKKVECYLYDTESIENLTCTFKKLSRLRASYSFDAYIRPGAKIKDIIVRTHSD